MKIVIVGKDLPGRTFCDRDGGELSNVHVAVQVGRDPFGLVPGDAPAAQWELDVRVEHSSDGEVDFKGPAVHGKRGERFLYITWGAVTPGSFGMFRRAKLLLGPIDREIVNAADTDGHTLVGVIRLTDDRGGPRCARVDSTALRWSVGTG